jgi:hypothetical protein
MAYFTAPDSNPAGFLSGSDAGWDAEVGLIGLRNDFGAQHPHPHQSNLVAIRILNVKAKPLYSRSSVCYWPHGDW